LRLTGFQLTGRFLQVPVQSRAVEWNHDDLAAMGIVTPLLLFWNIKDSEGKMSNVAILYEHPWTFDFISVVYCPIGIAQKVRGPPVPSISTRSMRLLPLILPNSQPPIQSIFKIEQVLLASRSFLDNGRWVGIL
jgi:hypothetical protein